MVHTTTASSVPFLIKLLCHSMAWPMLLLSTQVMLAGELRCCTVRLTNSGLGALANLRLAVASPDVFCGARSPDDAFKTLRAEPVPVESFRDGQALYALGPGARLAPGESLRWPLWLHPRAAGELAFHYVWHYEPEEPVDGMRYRCGGARVWLGLAPTLSEGEDWAAAACGLHRHGIAQQWSVRKQGRSSAARHAGLHQLSVCAQGAAHGTQRHRAAGSVRAGRADALPHGPAVLAVAPGP